MIIRVAFIVNRFPKLSETFILNQITGLMDRGVDVDIYARHPSMHPKIHADVQRYNLIDRTCYLGIKESDFGLTGEAISGLMRRSYRQSQTISKLLDGNPLEERLDSISALCKDMLSSGQGRYDIIHCHYGPNGCLGVLLKDVGVLDGKVVTTFHGYDLSRLLKQKGNDVYDYLFEKGELFMPISERWRKKIGELGCDKRKIVVHKMAVDTRKFKLISRGRRRTTNKVRLLTIGRLSKKKGIEYGIRAVARVVEKYPWVEYRIVGDGHIRSKVEALIEELKIAGKVEVLGWMQQEDIIKLMEKADILLAPSVRSADGNEEGIPVVLMEALAQGIPVISTWHSGIPELIQDGESGFLVPEKDVGALAEKLEYLITHPKIWSEFGRKGRKFVEEHHDIERQNDQLLEIYQRLLVK
ncbi:glycosyltransferase [bacterium]|nr:glycosyltransferase [bacterium]